MSQCVIVCFVMFMFCLFAAPVAAQPAATSSPDVLTDEKGRPYRIYVEAMPGETWDDKIRNAINKAVDSWSGAEIILPGRTIELTQPIRVWRQRVIESKGIDTRADGIALAYLGNSYEAIRGGVPSDLPRGITLRGTSRGSTNIVWKGEPNQVVIDMPAPWYCKVSDLSIDGQNTEGLVGIRFRAGWEFGHNGGKHNIFENLTITRVDVGIDIGGPFLPDLVDGSFRMIRVEAARIAIRVIGANVAEMWFREISIGTVQEAGFKLTGYPGRLLRSKADKDTPTPHRVVTDNDGREIFIEQVQAHEQIIKQQVQMKPHAEVAGSESHAWVGGGSSTCIISHVEAHMHDPRSWLIDAEYAPVRLEHVRMEGCAPVLRARSFGSKNSRFNDVLIDVNAISFGGVDGHVVEYDRPNTLVIIGGTFEGPIGLGNQANCHVVGATFMSHPDRTRYGIIPEGAELPEDSYFTRTGKAAAVHYRGSDWKGERLISGPQKEPRIMQLRGTSGAKVYQMPASTPPAE